MKVVAIYPPSIKKNSFKEKIALRMRQEQWLRETSHNFLTDEEFKQISQVKKQNIGLLSIAAVLKNAGIDVSYHVLQREDEIGSVCIEPNDIVFITSMTHDFLSAKLIANKIKQKEPRVKIVIGGHHAPFLAHDILLEKQNPFDYIIGGYGENKVLSLMNALQNEKEPLETHQIIFKNKDGSLYYNTEKSYPTPSEISIPSNELVEGNLIFARVFTTYGCPYNCLFCNHYNVNYYCERDLNQVKQELEYLVREKGTKYIFFDDPTFGVNLKRTEKLIQIVDKLGLSWGYGTRLNIIENMLKEKSFQETLRESNCRIVEIGVESLNKKVLETSRKEVDTSDAVNILEEFKHNTGLETLTYWIFALPGSTFESLAEDEACRLYLTKKGFHITLSMFCPFPGTPIFNNPEKFGMKIHTRKWSEYTMEGYPVFSLKDISRDEIAERYKNEACKLSQEIAKKLKTDPLKLDCSIKNMHSVFS